MNPHSISWAAIYRSNRPWINERRGGWVVVAVVLFALLVAGACDMGAI
jgi:hypothetical protein